MTILPCAFWNKPTAGELLAVSCICDSLLKIVDGDNDMASYLPASCQGLEDQPTAAIRWLSLLRMMTRLDATVKEKSSLRQRLIRTATIDHRGVYHRGRDVTGV